MEEDLRGSLAVRRQRLDSTVERRLSEDRNERYSRRPSPVRDVQARSRQRRDSFPPPMPMDHASPVPQVPAPRRGQGDHLRGLAAAAPQHGGSLPGSRSGSSRTLERNDSVASLTISSVKSDSSAGSAPVGSAAQSNDNQQLQRHQHQQQRESAVQLLRALYTARNPAKLDNVDHIIKHYSGRLDTLFQQLYAKYDIKDQPPPRFDGDGFRIPIEAAEETKTKAAEEKKSKAEEEEEGAAVGAAAIGVGAPEQERTKTSGPNSAKPPLPRQASGRLQRSSSMSKSLKLDKHGRILAEMKKPPPPPKPPSRLRASFGDAADAAAKGAAPGIFPKRKGAPIVTDKRGRILAEMSKPAGPPPPSPRRAPGAEAADGRPPPPPPPASSSSSSPGGRGRSASKKGKSPSSLPPPPAPPAPPAGPSQSKAAFDNGGHSKAPAVTGGNEGSGGGGGRGGGRGGGAPPAGGRSGPPPPRPPPTNRASFILARDAQQGPLPGGAPKGGARAAPGGARLPPPPPPPPPSSSPRPPPPGGGHLPPAGPPPAGPPLVDPSSSSSLSSSSAGSLNRTSPQPSEGPPRTLSMADEAPPPSRKPPAQKHIPARPPPPPRPLAAPTGEEKELAHVEQQQQQQQQQQREEDKEHGEEKDELAQLELQLEQERGAPLSSVGKVTAVNGDFAKRDDPRKVSTIEPLWEGSSGGDGGGGAGGGGGGGGGSSSGGGGGSNGADDDELWEGGDGNASADSSRTAGGMEISVDAAPTNGVLQKAIAYGNGQNAGEDTASDSSAVDDDEWGDDAPQISMRPPSTSSVNIKAMLGGAQSLADMSSLASSSAPPRGRMQEQHSASARFRTQLSSDAAGPPSSVDGARKASVEDLLGNMRLRRSGSSLPGPSAAEQTAQSKAGGRFTNVWRRARVKLLAVKGFFHGDLAAAPEGGSQGSEGLSSVLETPPPEGGRELPRSVEDDVEVEVEVEVDDDDREEEEEEANSGDERHSAHSFDSDDLVGPPPTTNPSFLQAQLVRPPAGYEAGTSILDDSLDASVASASSELPLPPSTSRPSFAEATLAPGFADALAAAAAASMAPIVEEHGKGDLQDDGLGHTDEEKQYENGDGSEDGAEGMQDPKSESGNGGLGQKRPSLRRMRPPVSHNHFRVARVRCTYPRISCIFLHAVVVAWWTFPQL